MHYVDAKGILSANNVMNIYRGCSHGCIYCDSRSLCYNMQHDFEDIEVKRNAPKLLEAALRRKRARCMVSTGAMCDPYLHIEKTERLTRSCLEIIDKHCFGVSIITKSDLILRDLDLLRSINEHSKCVVAMTLTTYDEELCRVLEPKVCTTRRRFETLCMLRDAGIPTVVWLTPTLPFINDTEENLRGLLDYCFEAEVRGVISFGSFGVTLREGDREYFYSNLDRSFPGMKGRYIKSFGNAYECPSPNASQLMRILLKECKARGVMTSTDSIFKYAMEFEDKLAAQQISLF